MVADKSNWFQKLKDHLLKRNQPEKIIDYSFAKLFQPRKCESNGKNIITFTKTSILIINNPENIEQDHEK